MEEILGLKIKKVDNDDILLFDFLENQVKTKDKKVTPEELAAMQHNHSH